MLNAEMANLRSSYFAEGVILIASAGFFVATSIRYQYIYQIVSEAHNFTSNKSLNYCLEDSNISSQHEGVVADEVSRWQLYITLASSLPAVFSALILTSWSDKVGRKVALFFPLFGYAVSNVMQLFIIMYSLPPYMLVISSAVVGLTGSFTAMLNIGMAYISDVTTKKDKLKRYTYVECGMGLAGGVITFACGFWITDEGFLPSSWLAAGCSCAAVLLIPVLPYPKYIHTTSKTCSTNSACNSDMGVRIMDQNLPSNICETNCRCKMNGGTIYTSTFVSRIKLMWKVYTYENNSCYMCNFENESFDGRLCPHGDVGRRGRVWRILLYLIMFNLYIYPMLGSSVIDTMYFVSYPLCFLPETIGIRSALVFGSLAFGPPLVTFWKSVLRWQNGSLLVLAVSAAIAINVTLAFAMKASTVFVVSAMYVFSQIASPVIRAQISSLASASEQGYPILYTWNFLYFHFIAFLQQNGILLSCALPGAALGVISGTETFTNMIANITYLMIYPVTWQIMRGFIFLYSTAIFLIVFFIVIFVWTADKVRDKKLKNAGYSLLFASG